MKKTIFMLLAIILVMGSCSKKTKSAKLRIDTDSVAYVLGLNIAQNLIKMDSTINYQAVCKGICDAMEGQAIMSMEDAKTYFLAYVNYALPEKARALEEQFLEDISKSNRSYARTRSGVTYTVSDIGDQNMVPMSESDSVTIRYVIKTSDGKQIYSSYERNDTTGFKLSDMPRGVKESIKLIGQGGKIQTWVPSKEAYGEEGNKELGIQPNTTLYYEIELIKVDKYMNRFR